MKTMDWKRGAGVACLLMTVTASESRAQSRTPVREPAGIPVVRGQSMQALGSPFSPEYQGAYYQSQANRVAMLAWAEHDVMMRQAYLAELAARKKDIDAKAAAEKAEKAAMGGADENGKVLWTKVGKPVGSGWGWPWGKKERIISSVPVSKTLVSSDSMATPTVVAESSSTVIDGSPTMVEGSPAMVVESPTMMPVPKDAAPMIVGKAAPMATEGKVLSSKVTGETVYEIKPDGSMVQMQQAPIQINQAPAQVQQAPTATVKIIEAGPTTIATQPAAPPATR